MVWMRGQRLAAAVPLALTAFSAAAWSSALQQQTPQSAPVEVRPGIAARQDLAPQDVAPRQKAQPIPATDPRASLAADDALLGTPLACQTSECRAVGSEEACTACRMWDRAANRWPDDAVLFAATIIDGGIALRVTSEDPVIQESLWNVATARQRLLELARRGERVPLCAPCLANVQAFEELRLETLRLPDGVLVHYTSENPYLVLLLQELVLSGSHHLPL